VRESGDGGSEGRYSNVHVEGLSKGSQGCVFKGEADFRCECSSQQSCVRRVDVRASFRFGVRNIKFSASMFPCDVVEIF